MSLLDLLLRFLFDDDSTYSNKQVRNHRKAPDKHVIVKNKGQQTHYRINQYGELFED